MQVRVCVDVYGCMSEWVYVYLLYCYIYVILYLLFVIFALFNIESVLSTKYA